MVSYTTRMPSGFPGRVTRSDSLTIEPGIIDQATPPTVFGAFVKNVAGKLQPIAASDAATVVYGVLVSAYPTQSTSNPLGVATPPASGVIDVLRRGYVSVPLQGGTAVKGAAVYVVTTAGTGFPVATIATAASPGGGSAAVAVANTFFTGPADSGSVVEIEFNI